MSVVFDWPDADLVPWLVYGEIIATGKTRRRCVQTPAYRAYLGGRIGGRTLMIARSHGYARLLRQSHSFRGVNLR